MSRVKFRSSGQHPADKARLCRTCIFRTAPSLSFWFTQLLHRPRKETMMGTFISHLKPVLFILCFISPCSAAICKLTSPVSSLFFSYAIFYSETHSLEEGRGGAGCLSHGPGKSLKPVYHVFCCVFTHTLHPLMLSLDHPL
jgi:hypothetical protein